MYNEFKCSIAIPLTALLGSINLFQGIKLHSLKYPPNMLGDIPLQPIMFFVMLAYLMQDYFYPFIYINGLLEK